jgi:hypothetical protein
MIGLIVGGIALVVIVGAAIGAYILLRGGGPLGTSLGVNPKCTRDNALKLRMGMTPERASEFLGDGRACSAQEILDATNATFDADYQGMAAVPLVVGEKSCGADTWYRWQNGSCHVLAGFRKSKTGVDRLVYAQYLKQYPGGAFEHADLVIWHDHNQDNLDWEAPD